MADLIPPHGGLSQPVNRTVAAADIPSFQASAASLPKVPISQADLSTVYRIADGTLSPLPPLAGINRNGVFGAMYVLEGSRLGAKYLLRGVAQAADPVVATATAYLAHGAGQHFWQSFLAALEQEPATPDDEAEIIDAAGLAFSVFAHAAARV